MPKIITLAKKIIIFSFNFYLEVFISVVEFMYKLFFYYKELYPIFLFIILKLVLY